MGSGVALRRPEGAIYREHRPRDNLRHPVEEHVNLILAKLNAANRAEIAASVQARNVPNGESVEPAGTDL